MGHGLNQSELCNGKVSLRTSTGSGYVHPAYAASLSEFGEPRHLPRCDGWILERKIPNTPYRDAIGPYPLFSCLDWTQLEHDLNDVGEELVSLMLVPAPLDRFNQEMLDRCFDRVIEFKQHYVADLNLQIKDIVKKSHKNTVSRAKKKVDVSICSEPQTQLDRWLELFNVLVNRHEITGVRAFSKDAFAKQLSVPGTVVFEARANGQTVGLDWWYLQDNVAYGHLVAFSELD